MLISERVSINKQVCGNLPRYCYARMCLRAQNGSVCSMNALDHVKNVLDAGAQVM